MGAEKISRRRMLEIVGGVIGGLVVGGAIGYLAKAPGVVEKTVTKTLPGTTVTKTVTATPTTTATATPSEWMKYFPTVDALCPEWVKKAAGYPKGFLIEHDWARSLPWDEIKAKFKGEKCTQAVEAVDVRPTLMFKPGFVGLTGTDVDVISIPSAVLHEKLMAELVAGTGRYDLIDMFGCWSASYDPYVIDIRPLCEKYDINIDSFHPCFRMMMERAGGKIIGLVKDADIVLLHVRMNLLEKVGWDHPPRTFEELEAFCEDAMPTAKKEGWYPWVEYPGLAKGFWTTWVWETYALQFKDFTILKPGTWEPDFVTPGSIEALKIMKRLLKYCPPGNIDLMYDDTRELWLAGKTAMCQGHQCTGQQCYDPEMSKISPYATDNVIEHFPVVIGDVLRAPFNWTTTFMGIPKASKHQELAFLWSAFISSQEASMIMAASATGTECGHTEAIKNPIMWKMDRCYKAEWECLHTAYTTPWDFIPEGFEIEEAIGEYLYGYLAGEIKDAETALKKAEERAREILRKGGYLEGKPPVEPPILSVEEWCKEHKVPLPKP